MRLALLRAAGALATLAAIGGAQSPQPKAAPDAALSPADRALIANAMSAAPPSVAANATAMGHDGRVLRRGTSGWVCMPDLPDVPNDTPMCVDATWRGFLDAWMHARTPTVNAVGFGYMLQEDMPVSNTDPFAKAPTPTNAWIQRGAPHVMILFPDARLLDGLPTDPTNGGPFVMWKGTPYAHLMVPVAPAPKP